MTALGGGIKLVVYIGDNLFIKDTSTKRTIAIC